MYVRFGKRIVDFCTAFAGLALFAVPMGIIAILIKMTSGGPVFFRQKRVGQFGGTFVLVKFRTMTADHGNGSTVTVRGDSRITAFGKFLRRSKLDEYPQLWNVLKGDMSLVGPRPDVPGYYDQLKGDDRRILGLRPGITGPSTLKYAAEEELLARQPDPERYNDEILFPDKVRMNLQYLDHCSLARDVALIWETMCRSFARSGRIVS